MEKSPVLGIVRKKEIRKYINISEYMDSIIEKNYCLIKELGDN